jgi:VanZ family protein
MSELMAARSRRALTSAFKLAFVIATLMVVVLSLLPNNDLPPVGISDKFEHIIAYAVLALLGGFAFPRAIVLLAVMLPVLGVAMEICQMAVPGRSAEIGDAVADAIGVGLILVPLAVLRLVRRR